MYLTINEGLLTVNKKIQLKKDLNKCKHTDFTYQNEIKDFMQYLLQYKIQYFSSAFIQYVLPMKRIQVSTRVNVIDIRNKTVCKNFVINL